MMLRLDTPLRLRDTTVAVLCEQSVHALSPGGLSLVTGRKIPLAVVFATSERIWAQDLRGRLLDVETLEVACPGLRAQIARGA